MRRHPLDPFSLIFGAAFTAIGIVFGVASADVWTLNPKWIWPVPLIVVGALIIALSTRGETDRHPRAARPADDEPA